MRLRLAGGICFLVIATSAMSETTRLDNEFFAFKPTQVWAIRDSGKWIAAPRLFTLGATGKKFSIDARAASAIVPEACRLLFSSDLPMNSYSATMPTVVPVLGGENTQQIFFWSQNCSVILWLTGERDPQFDPKHDFKSILPKNNRKSASVGLIVFNNRGKVATLEFAILVEDLPAE